MSQLVRQISPTPLVRTSQPQQAVEIDWSNPLTRGLVSVYLLLPGIWDKNLVTGRVGGVMVGTGCSFVGGRFRTPGTANNGARFKHGLSNPVSGDFTIATGFKRVSGSVAWSLMRQDVAGDSWHGWYGTGTGSVSSINETAFDTTRGNFSVPSAECYAFRHVGGTAAMGSIGGLLTDSTATYPTGVNNADITLGWRDAAFVEDNPSVSDFSHIFVYNRGLSDQELLAVGQNPWQIFKPIVRRYPFDLVRGPVQTRQSRMLGTSDGAAASVAPAVLGLRSVCTQQPQQAVGIDWGNPITRGLVCVDAISVARNVVTNKSDAIVGTKIVNTRNGQMRGFGATVGVSTSDSVETSLNTTSDYRTYFFIANLRTGATDLGRIFDKRVSGAQAEACFFNNAQVAFSYQKVFSGGGLFAIDFPYGGTDTVNRHCLVVNSKTGEFAITHYLNGSLSTATTVLTAVGSPVTNSDNFVIGSRKTDALRCFDGSLSDFLVWDRLLSASEARSISQNPWQIFRPLTKQIWVAA